MNQIKKVSHFYRILFQTIFFIIPIAVLLYWLFYGDISLKTFEMHIFSDQLQQELSKVPLTFIQKILAFLTSMIPATIIMIGLKYLINLFKLYEKGLIFTSNNIRCLRNIGYVIFAWVISSPIYDALISLVLTFQKALNGKRAIVVSFGSPEVEALLLAGLILLISWVMNEGRKLKEEQDQVI